MKKRMLAMLLCMAMVLSLLPMAALAADTSEWIEVDGIVGGKIKFDTSTGTIVDCSASVTSANIPGEIQGVPVTAVGDRSFLDCRSLRSVSIPSSVTSIGDSAFSGCNSLSSVSIPGGVTSIGDSAFSGCRNLSSVSIPGSVTSIGSYAFSGCSSLRSVSIPSSVTSIGNCAFSGCSSLRSVSIPSSVTSIGSYAFSDCSSLSSVSIPGSVTSIGNSAFSGCSSLRSVSIPSSVTSIGSGVFSRCSNLSSVSIPGSVTSIGSSAFSGCSSLRSVSIPNSVTSIGSYAFSGCRSLSSVSVPDGVISIGSYAFFSCSNLSSVSIPGSVTSIGTGPFGSCTSLDRIFVDPTNSSYCSDGDGVLFNKSKTHLIQYLAGNTRTSYSIPNSVTSIGEYAFYDCRSLSSVSIPSSVTSIGEYAFKDCSSLSSVSIPSSVTSIGSGVFSRCSNLSGVSIPGSVTSIGNSAFSYCSSLADVYYAGTEKEWKKISIGNYNADLVYATIHFNSTGPEGDKEEETSNVCIEWPENGQTLDDFSTSITITVQGNYSLGSGILYIKNWEDEIIQELTLTADTLYYDSDKNVTQIDLSSSDCSDLPGGEHLYLDIESDTLISADTGESLNSFPDKNTWSFYTPKKVGKDVWGFRNYESKVDRSIWLKLYRPGQALYHILLDSNYYTGGAGGLCAGMAATAMTFDLGYISYNDFVQEPIATSVSSLTKDAKSQALGMTADEYIKLGYAMQFCSDFSAQKKDNRTKGNNSSGNLKELYDAVKAYESTGIHPVLIYLLGNGAHGVWGYGIESHDGYESILIYNPNIPKKETEIILYGKYPNFTSWTYPTDPEYTDISYVLGYESVYFAATELQEKSTRSTSDTSYVAQIQSDDYNLFATNLSAFTVSKSGEESFYDESVISGADGLILPIDRVTTSGAEETEYLREFWIETDSEMAAQNHSGEERDIVLANKEHLLEYSLPASGETKVSNTADTITVDISAENSEASQETIILSRFVNDEILRLKVTGKLNGQCTVEQTGSGITVSGMDIGQVTTSYKDEEVNKLENLSDAAISIQWRTKDGCTYVIITSDKNLDGVYETPLVSPVLIDGTPAVIPPAQSESGNTVFSISVSPATGGVVAVSPKSASKGSAVTITATPNTGYQLDKLTVTDKNGNSIKLTDQGNGKYTFTMPASKVSASASFAEVEVPAPALPFADVTASDWFYDAVAYVYNNGLMTGTSDTTFSPNATTTRGMLVTILHRLEGEPAANDAGFTDVENGAWYQAAVDWAAANGIVNGTSETTFDPNGTLTREQMAAILYRYAAYKGYDVSQLADLSRFSDSSAVSTYAADALAWANAAGLITGVTDTTLSPQGSAVRAQAATILMRFCENIAQ